MENRFKGMKIRDLPRDAYDKLKALWEADTKEMHGFIMIPFHRCWDDKTLDEMAYNTGQGYVFAFKAKYDPDVKQTKEV